ncbi:sulfatase-like hydrolase/transferase [Candidatus Pelagibacter sp.]|nr:sulfatase-like hydrolase/transferase [Candidatus Pelagibacter sp.]
MFGDIKDIGELMYALGSINSGIIYLILSILIVASIIVNYKHFKINIFLIQIFCIFLIYGSFIYTNSYKKFFYSKKVDSVVVENLSAAFRFIGSVDAFFFNYLDTVTFERELKSNKEEIKYSDFRIFELNNIKNKNIHIILMESFLDPTDFTNVKIKKNAIPNKWIKYKKDNLFYGMSPVTGGGSAQAEFEILCGAPSTKKYGTEFNRIGEYQTTCLPNYLKKFGYKSFASQPVYGSFFNVEIAYKSIGFDKSFLATDFDMSDKSNGWLSNESFFNQQFEMIKKPLSGKNPILNYVFAVGCHNALGQKQSFGELIKFEGSQSLEDFLNCNTKSIQEILKYIDKIRDIDPNSLFIILPDHHPVISPNSSWKKSGYQKPCDDSISCGRKMRGIFFSNDAIIDKKNYAYYELPELIVNIISNNTLCDLVECSTEKDYIISDNKIVNRENLLSNNNQLFANYYEKLYMSILKESWSN